MLSLYDILLVLSSNFVYLICFMRYRHVVKVIDVQGHSRSLPVAPSEATLDYYNCFAVTMVESDVIFETSDIYNN